jgi:quinol monooxygenase YgiN
MIIIAGYLTVDPADRDRYLEVVADVAPTARKAPGCLDFVQAADPIEPGRINIYERWDSDEDLHRFRTSGTPGPDTPEIREADVKKYRISAVEAP